MNLKDGSMGSTPLNMWLSCLLPGAVFAPDRPDCGEAGGPAQQRLQLSISWDAAATGVNTVQLQQSTECTQVVARAMQTSAWCSQWNSLPETILVVELKLQQCWWGNPTDLRVRRTGWTRRGRQPPGGSSPWQMEMGTALYGGESHDHIFTTQQPNQIF